MTENLNVARSTVSPRRLLVPLALAQFICSFAGSNMNVMINDISTDLDTTVQGVQTAITLFLLVMAALMIPGSKLSDRWGRKRCFTVGLTVYGVGALLSAVAPGLGILILGNSILEGVGSALLIPPVYILTTLLFTDLQSPAWPTPTPLGGSSQSWSAWAATRSSWSTRWATSRLRPRPPTCSSSWSAPATSGPA
jgi:MFS family permease